MATSVLELALMNGVDANRFHAGPPPLTEGHLDFVFGKPAKRQAVSAGASAIDVPFRDDASPQRAREGAVLLYTNDGFLDRYGLVYLPPGTEPPAHIRNVRRVLGRWHRFR